MNHDPLCSLSTKRCCIGCLFVQLREDATYGTPTEREEGVRKLRQIIESAQAHLYDALEHGSSEMGDD